MYIFEVLTFFSHLMFIQSHFFSDSGYFYRVYTFDGAFFFLTTVAMITEKSVFFLFPLQPVLRNQILSSQSCSLSIQTTVTLKHWSQKDRDYS